MSERCSVLCRAVSDRITLLMRIILLIRPTRYNRNLQRCQASRYRWSDTITFHKASRSIVSKRISATQSYQSRIIYEADTATAFQCTQ